MMPARVATTLVTGASAREREQAIADIVHQNGAFYAIILEGLPDGQPILHPSPLLLIERIAPGCLCCAGNLVLRVTLNRLLRRAPTSLVIGVANAGHLDQLRSWLQSAPYDQLLELGPTHHT
ncbi:MAG: GTPase [Telluria sp.]